MSPMILTSSAPAEAMTNRKKEREATARARIYKVDVLHTLLSTTGLAVRLSNPHPASEMPSHHYIRWCPSIACMKGSVTDSCAITPWRKGAHSSRAIARKALAGTHRTNHIDIQQLVMQSHPANMTTLDQFGLSLTGRIHISTVMCYAS